MTLLLRLRAAIPTPNLADGRLLVKMSAAGTLAWWLCTLAGQPRPLFAALVPLVSMLGDPYAALNVSLSRVLGVFIGVLLGIGLIELPLSSSTAIVAILFVTSLALGLAIRIGGALNSQIAISAIFMVYLGEASKAETVGFARIWETAIGAGVSILVSSLVWPPDPLAETRRRRARLAGWVEGDLVATADLLEHGAPDDGETLLEAVRERSLQAVRYVLELDRGSRALRLNPLRRADRPAFQDERRRLALAARAHRHLRTVTRFVADSVEESGGHADAARAAGLAEAARTLAAAASAAVNVDGTAAAPLLLRAEAELDAVVPETTYEHAIAGKLRQLAADLS